MNWPAVRIHIREVLALRLAANPGLFIVAIAKSSLSAVTASIHRSSFHFRTTDHGRLVMGSRGKARRDYLPLFFRGTLAPFLRLGQSNGNRLFLAFNLFLCLTAVQLPLFLLRTAFFTSL